MAEKMTKFEKLALSSAASGAVFNVFLYGIGATLDKANDGTLFYARVAAAILQAAAFDLVAIATVMGMGRGKRSRWSMATAGASALVSAAIALDVAGVLTMPWLHAANALIVLAFTLHLLTPRRSTRAAQLRRLVGRLVTAIRQARQERDSARQAVASRDMALASIQAELAATRAELTRRPPPVTVEVVRVAKFELTWQQVEQLARALRQAETISLSTIRRRVAEIAPALTDEGD